MSSVNELLAAAEGYVARPLTDEETIMVCRMHEAGADAAAVLQMFEAPTPDPEEEKTVRFEPASGSHARRIP